MLNIKKIGYIVDGACKFLSVRFCLCLALLSVSTSNLIYSRSCLIVLTFLSTIAARSAKLPCPGAYLNSARKFSGGRGGVNFAVAGSTALPAEVLSSKNIMNIVTNESLSTQLEWMFSYFNTTCSKGNRHVSYDVSIVKSFSNHHA